MKREERIGSSDIAGIAGLDTYNTPISIWMRKMGEGANLDDNDAIWFGNAMEEIVAHRWAEKNEKQVIRSQETFSLIDQPWATATPDYFVDDSILEIKTTEQYWDNGIPERVTAQVVWQMGICGKKHAYVVALGHRRKLLTFEIDFDQALFDGLLALATQFYNEHMLTKVPPKPLRGDDLEHVKSLYQNTIEAELKLDDHNDAYESILHYENIKEIYAKASKAMSEAKEQMDLEQAKLRMIMGEHKMAVCNGRLIQCKETKRKGFTVAETTIKTFTIKPLKEK